MMGHPNQSHKKGSHNQPDIVLWNKKDLTCNIIDIAVPLDLNATSKSKDKMNDYMVLLSELQRIYPRYCYQIIPVVIGALGTVQYSLEENLKKLQLKKTTVDQIIKKIQKRALIGTMKIAKTTLNM